MRCKPGDLAVIVYPGPYAPRALGMVVRLTELHPYPFKHGPAWCYEGRRIFNVRNDEIDAINDICLRPIRDNDADDETLTWACKPAQVTS